MPKISVCATCYNHEKYILEFVESLQAQTEGDWELNVVDDCSTDGSFALLKDLARKDSRIHPVRNDRNRHLCYSGNRAASMAQADLITLISCDDLFLPGKLASDCCYFAAHRDVSALYNAPQVVAANGEPIYDVTLDDDFSRWHLLKRELFGRNALCVPGLTLRKKAWEAVGGYHPLLRMTQDHELHIKLLEHFDVARLSEPTVRYRRHDGNLSATSPKFLNALTNESVYFLSEHYMKGIRDVAELLAVIPECREYGEPIQELIPYFLARYACEQGTAPEVRLAGLLALYRFLSISENCCKVERSYGFSAKNLMKLAEISVITVQEDLTAIEQNRARLLSLEADLRRQEADLRRQEADLRRISTSSSYRLGLFLSWPLRKAFHWIRD